MVSICIPTYNNIEGLLRLLDSIIIQNYLNYEVVITDDSEGYAVENLVKQYPIKMIRYYKNDECLGATANCNKAISLANGELIKVMHHDDWFAMRDSLKKFVEMISENKEVQIAFSGTKQVGNTRIYNRHISSDDVEILNKSANYLFLKNIIGGPSATIFRNNNYLFDTNLIWLFDIDFYLSILSKYPSFLYTTEPLVAIGISDSQLTSSCVNNIDLNINEYIYVYKKWIYPCTKRIYKKKIIEQFFKKNRKYNKQFKEFKISFFQYLIEVINYYLILIKKKNNKRKISIKNFLKNKKHLKKS